MNIIYAITCADKYYIGSTTNWANRKSNHRRCLERGVHCNKLLQEAFDSNASARGLEFKILETVDGDREALYIREQILLDRHFDDPKCINLSKHANKPTPNNLKAAQDKGRQSWYDKQQPFYLVKEGKEYGPFKTQKEAFDSLPISCVGVSKLWLGKQDIYKGFTIKFTSVD